MKDEKRRHDRHCGAHSAAGYDKHKRNQKRSRDRIGDAWLEETHLPAVEIRQKIDSYAQRT